MDSDLSDWLRLRESADRAARSRALTRTVTDTLASTHVVRVLDLATGTGANLRYLVEQLPGHQHWLVVDRSATLLSQLSDRTAMWGSSRGYEIVADSDGCAIHGLSLKCRIETRQMDLGRLDETAMFTGRHLVTASALLDLVSAEWLGILATRCRAAGAAVLLALTYNGMSSCSPADPEDAVIRDLLNRHQLRDKGLGGPAAGPAAAACAARCFSDAGYHVELAPSDWRLGSEDRALQRQLIEGWADAALDMKPAAAQAITAWRHRRLEHVAGGRSQIVVGHNDLAAWLGTHVVDGPTWRRDA